jgi:ABC-type bacteriocin/lantibiotic exporter with double-glycine peptidase domain
LPVEKPGAIMKKSPTVKKDRPSHSLLSNIKYLYQLQWKYCRLSFVFLMLLIPINLGVSYCYIYLPGFAINVIINDFTILQIIYFIGSVGLAMAILNTMSQLITTYNFALLSKFRESLIFLKTKKILYMDYQNLESPNCRIMAQRADEALWGSGDGSAAEQMVAGGTIILTNIFRYVLFGTVLSFANPLIVFVLTVTPVANFFLIRAVQKYQYANKNETAKLDKKLWYISNKAGDFKMAKDIRIYSMNGWLTNLYKNLSRKRLGWDKKYATKYFYADILNGIIVLLRDCIVYIILILMVIDNHIAIDEFVVCFVAAAGFGNWVSEIINKVSDLNTLNFNISDLRDFLAYPEKNKRSKGHDISHGACTISLRDISFRYEGADRETISRINLEIKAGEKVAIVGLNGAGKTTLIKLICGLYTPSCGDIYINGINKENYNIYDYYTFFSVVFQDRYFLPVSLPSIVACSKMAEEEKAEKIRSCIDISGLDGKLTSLPEGLDTPLNKQINKNGIELSGGEEQKLLLARALYKDGSILILDEPTASLDPIAEHNLYMQYNAMCTNKTSIFISHRLASTKFCDRILFMENGTMVESGTHDALIRQGGKYAHLFATQSQYYVE